ncbi:SSI family serine proteinase inhibitor [Streptomyces sp. NPDC057381]|uniref:SSI family serine proteinase inhibitor n=1 Tax=Streptomyces sp. NPDC057381 TaxID=3346111 RepID=UPI00362FFF5A
MTQTLTTRPARAALLAAAALLLTCATPAQAATQREPATDWLLLTVTREDARPGIRPAAPAGARPGAARRALLLCDPPRGHVRAERACAELDAAHGRIADIPVRETHCPMVHAPVTAQARGQWRGQPVEYERTFPNACVMAARTGSVFAWDAQDAPG